MSCLALSLQPANGTDILLQTREWFPPARALAALAAFRLTRISLSKPGSAPSTSTSQPQPQPQTEADILDPSSIGDDPLAASSGQVTVGVESKYRIVYRLVNTIYVLGITSVDSPNIFDTINTVNQAVAVVVAACRGVDVNPEKLHRKYPEIYMALDIVLRGVGSVRLATILSSIHGESIAKMVHTAIDAENKVRGADAWSGLAETQAIELRSTLEAFTNSSFELPSETLAAGDEVAATIAPPPPPEESKDQAVVEEPAAGQEEKDPFAASEKINKPEEALVGGFKKTKESDLALALAGLDVASLPPAEATKPTFVGVEGFEGEYGGIAFGNEETSMSEAFEGLDNAFGGGLDASEFITTKKKTSKPQGLGGLEFLTAGGPAPSVGAAAKGDGKTPLENILVEKKEMTGPEMFISEEINAEFVDSMLARVAFKGTVFLRTLPPKQAAGKETEFSFRVEGTSKIKRAALMSSCVSSVGDGMFHVRTQSREETIPIIRFSLLPKLTPLPLRVRLVKRHVGTLLSVMIQYASNPELPLPLSNVAFILKLPVDPTLLTVSPKAILNREERELRWHIPDIPLKGPAGKLRARMPLDVESGDGDVEVHGIVKFAGQGAFTLSGVYLRPATEGLAHFSEDINRFASGTYLCN